MLLFGLIEEIGPLLGVMGTVFWVWMLIDCLNRAKVRPNRGWLFFLLLFTHWVGALVYFFVYVYPLSKFFSSAPQQPVQQKPFIYYTPPTQTSHQEYQQGYQSRSVPYPAPPTPTTVSYQQEEQSFDYEEPHASYSEMPPQQQ